MQSPYIMRLLRKRAFNEKGCWIWKGAGDRYGHIRYGEQKIGTHVLAAIIWLLDYEKNLDVRHKCQNGLCFNPSHLEVGTRSQNILDQVRDGTHHEASKTHCKAGHEFTLENTYIYKDGKYIKRQCKLCKQRRMWEFTHLK